MKSDVFVQFRGDTVDTKSLMDTAKEIWKAEGNKVKDLHTVQLYLKPEEKKCYYVFNGEGLHKEALLYYVKTAFL